MCLPKKNKDNPPLTDRHTLLSGVYTAEFYSGSATPSSASSSELPLKVVRVFNSSFANREAVPNDVGPKMLEAFAPVKAEILTIGKEWKCTICCNSDASQVCSSIVGAPSMENVLSFSERIYFVCNNEECIMKATEKRNKDSKKYVVSDFGFRFSFRSALQPIRVDEGMSSTMKVPDTVKGTNKDEISNRSIPVEKLKKMVAEEERNAQYRCVSMIGTASLNATTTKRTRYETDNDSEEKQLQHDNNCERSHKVMKKVGHPSNDRESSGDSVGRGATYEGTFATETVRDPSVIVAKGNCEANVSKNIEPKRSPPIKVYLREFPFVFNGNGAWLCRHCQNHFLAGHIHSPPPKYFIDQHLRLCQIMSRYFPTSRV